MSATATNATIEPIKIGMRAPLSGSSAELGRRWRRRSNSQLTRRTYHWCPRLEIAGASTRR
jgi:hypothetical protein